MSDGTGRIVQATAGRDSGDVFFVVGQTADGRLLLVDAGGENRMNYCSDHTRTYPVSGRFTAQQREIYDIVLACHDHIARIVRPGMMYMQEVHLEAYRKLAEEMVPDVEAEEEAVENVYAVSVGPAEDEAPAPAEEPSDGGEE